MNYPSITIPPVVEALYQRYQSIPMPYFIAPQSKTLKRKIYKGKGRIEDIEGVLRGYTNDTRPKSEILKSLTIGIDCSGFVTWLYDAYTMDKEGKRIWTYFQRKTKNPLDMILFKIQPVVSMLNAATLTSDLNCTKIKATKDIRPMDLIKLSGGKHVVLVHTVYLDNNIPVKFSYIHATSGVGVCMGYVNITEPDKEVTMQDWLPLEPVPTNQPSDLIRYKVNINGIRRPHFLS